MVQIGPAAPQEMGLSIQRRSSSLRARWAGLCTASSSTPDPTSPCARFPSVFLTQELKFAGPLGRSVYSFFFDPKQRRSRGDTAEMFAPRRTAFVYDLEGPFSSDVPTMLRRSKEDCPKVRLCDFSNIAFYKKKLCVRP